MEEMKFEEEVTVKNDRFEGQEPEIAGTDSFETDPSEEIREKSVTDPGDPADGDKTAVTASENTSGNTSENKAVNTLPGSTVNESLAEIELRLDSINSMENRLLTEVREMHKLYHNEFAGRLVRMQDEIERYHKIESGRIFDDILHSLVEIYSTNENLPDEVTEPKANKAVRYMLQDIEDLLEVYGVSRISSKPGDPRDKRHCNVINRIQTDDPAKHDTIARSYRSGFHIGNRAILKEMTDIYVYGDIPKSVEEMTGSGSDNDKTSGDPENA